MDTPQRSPWAPLPEESSEAYMERLNQVDQASLSDREREILRRWLQAAHAALQKMARDRAMRPTPVRRTVPGAVAIGPAREQAAEDGTDNEAAALERVQAAVRALSQQNRQRLLLWVANGMPASSRAVVERTNQPNKRKP
jgi:hypothetical protein